MNINDVTITSLETINAFDVVTGNFLFTLDELQSATIAQTQEKTDITGKQGRKLNSLKRNKAVTISGNNGMVSGGLLELQTGGKFENRTTTVMWTDYLTVGGNAAETSFKAVGSLGNEIESVYVKNSDGTLGKVLTQGAEVAAGTFTYDPATKKLAFAEGEVADGAEIVVYYLRQIQADVLDNMSDTYSGKATLYVDAFAEDKCSNVYRIQFYIPKADFNGEFSFEMGDNQTVHAFEAESLAGSGCGAHNASGMLWTYTIFGANTEDYETGEGRMTVMAPADEVGYGTKKASELMSNVQIAWNGTTGTVTGNFKKVTEWDGLPGKGATGDAPALPGHFFAMKLDEKYKGKPFDFIKTKADGSDEKNSHTASAGADEMFWVLAIDDYKKFTFKSDGEVIVSLDFSKATLES